MNAKQKHAKEAEILLLECKECHGLVVEADLVAYHLVDRILYGWCQQCFSARPAREQLNPSLAA
jgi:hypothetical protein